MHSRNACQILFVVIILTAFCSGANAGKTVYKWVDEDGQVHFGDAPPADSNPAEAEVLVIPRSPPPVSPATPAATPAAATATDDKIPTTKPKAETPPLYEKIDISEMSIANLDLRCDEARERMIAPLREAEIAKCKQDQREDPAWCERFNVDYGEGGRTVSGSIRPRMFDDLPECVEALQEKNRRGR